jgi:hypothetical protein
MGKSGVGKSSALRNLPPEKTYIISPNAKTLPIPGAATKYVEGRNLLVCNDLLDLKDYIKQVADNAPHIKYLVIEDFTHFFSARIFSSVFASQTSGNAAFQRWMTFGTDVFQALFADTQNLRSDLFIIVIHHTEVKEDGVVGFKSPGKLLDNTIDVPSYFTYVLHGKIVDSEAGAKYLIQTNKTGSMDAKTPPGLFPLDMRNDLLPILERIESYSNGEIEIPEDAWR